MSDPLPVTLLAVLGALTLIAAVSDLRVRQIPNWLVLAGLAGGIALGLLHGRAKASLLGFALALLIYLPLYALRAMGGGDVKLMAAVGAIAGPSNWMIIFILTAIIGAVIGLVLLLWKKGFGRAFGNIAHILKELLRGRAPHASRKDLDIGDPRAITMPHGVSIALGTLLFLIASRP